MDPLERIAAIFECSDVAGAFRDLSSALGRDVPIRAALCIAGNPPVAQHSWPAGVVVSQELLDTAAHVLRPESFPLGSQFPHDAVTFSDAEMLLLPLGRSGDNESSTLVLIGAADAFGDSLEPWARMAAVFARFKNAMERVERAERSAEDFRQRLQEAEALHTLGLATNRTLDLDEVLDLVTRLARSLLGAQCASVHIKLGEQLRRGGAIGFSPVLSNEDTAEQVLVSTVMNRDKALIAGDLDSCAAVSCAPELSAPAGMQMGLGLPLSLFGDTFGALVLGYRAARELTERDMRLARTLTAQAAVAITNATLYQRVQEHSEELAQAYEKLRELTAAKERFYNAVAHDLRTPAGAIKGYHDLIIDGLGGELPQKAGTFLTGASRAADSLLTLVNDLMDFAKLEAGKVEMHYAPVAVREIVDEAFAAVQPQAALKGLQLRTLAGESMLSIQTDRTRVRQILINLLSNAVKFTTAGEVVLSVHMSGEQNALDGEVIEIHVRDTGAGIAEADRERIFLEFEQVAGSAGTGLGLPISRKLARLLGGDLRVESELGQGSTFVLTLPQEQAAARSTSDRRNVFVPTRRSVRGAREAADNLAERTGL